jgi:hypothetical protein
MEFNSASLDLREFTYGVLNGFVEKGFSKTGEPNIKEYDVKKKTKFY